MNLREDRLDKAFGTTREAVTLGLKGLHELSYNQFAMAVIDEDGGLSAALMQKVIMLKDDVLFLQLLNTIWSLNNSGKVRRRGPCSSAINRGWNGSYAVHFSIY